MKNFLNNPDAAEAVIFIAILITLVGLVTGLTILNTIAMVIFGLCFIWVMPKAIQAHRRAKRVNGRK